MVINVEIRLKNVVNPQNKEELIAEIKQTMPEYINNSKPFSPPAADKEIFKNVDRVICFVTGKQYGIRVQCSPEEWKSANYFLYNTTGYGPLAQEIAAGNDGGDGAIGSYHWELPTIEFEDLWESLVYDSECPKEELLKFVESAMKMVQSNVNPAIIPQNRLVLLKGPPGTGKTTLCKAVAQKIAIRMPFTEYKKVHFVEVNSHSLFSKWFSESGKLIQKLFDRIEELAERKDQLIFVLIDEVESLTMGREASINGNDPTDSVRAVNAVLTQLDKMKRFPNVFILCTSNIQKALDPAFVNRIGLVHQLGNPGEQATLTILMESTKELVDKGLLRGSADTDNEEIIANECWEIARSIREKLCGRTIRNFPLEAFSKRVDNSTEEYLNNLSKIAMAKIRSMPRGSDLF